MFFLKKGKKSPTPTSEVGDKNSNGSSKASPRGGLEGVPFSVLAHGPHRLTVVAAAVVVRAHAPTVEVQSVRAVRVRLVERRQPVAAVRTHVVQPASPAVARGGKEDGGSIGPVNLLPITAFSVVHSEVQLFFSSSFCSLLGITHGLPQFTVAASYWVPAMLVPISRVMGTGD